MRVVFFAAVASVLVAIAAGESWLHDFWGL